MGDTTVDRMQGWLIPDPRYCSLVDSGVLPLEYRPRGVGKVFDLTPDCLSDILDLYVISDGRVPRALRVPMTRWWRSKSRSEFDLVDTALDLRIALETVFRTPNPELSFRMAMRGAWYVGTDGEDRVRIFNLLRKAYQVCSTAAHTGRIENRKGREGETLTAAQDICRRAIIKRLQGAGEEPNWDRLVLNA